jgi:nucleotide-binding universal stress UspA family protein
MLVEGTVADALVSIAEKEHGDLIALGSHDRGLVDRLLLGSVRTKVLRHAPCTVLIVPELNEAPH